MPSRRTFARFASGSLFDRIEMKIRLSMPSTTSITMRAKRAAQTVGSAASARRFSMAPTLVGWWGRRQDRSSGELSATP